MLSEPDSLPKKLDRMHLHRPTQLQLLSDVHRRLLEPKPRQKQLLSDKRSTGPTCKPDTMQSRLQMLQSRLDS